MRKIDLGGKWSVDGDNGHGRVNATVPGCIHTDLLAAKKIPEPFNRDNERHLQWISETNWKYSRSFTVSKEFLNHDCALLCCEGLDTFACIRLNGKKIAETDNQFRTYDFDVKKHLKSGKNEITVEFASVYPYIDKKMKQRPLIASSFVSWDKHGRSYVRKSPCNFGWDWGPAFATCGIWRKIELVAFNTGRISDIHIRQKHSANKKAVTLDVAVQAGLFKNVPVTAVVSVALKGDVVCEQKAVLKGGKAGFALKINEPRLWWPNGMGAQPLYEVTVSLQDESGVLLDKLKKHVGLRTLVLDQHKDQWGESFQFKVNGMPFFAKGANWIPADAFVTSITRERYEHLLVSAAKANMNMLRVWGGGIYEDDMFYDICDSLGICVWQDFMFACASYPAYDPEFLENVRVEAADNIKRLRHHACIALWCGNNELEQCKFMKPGKQTWFMSIPEYKQLFDKLLPDVVKKIDPDACYIPSSAYTPGKIRFKDPCNPDSGDAHLWEVWHGKKPFEWYRTCTHRFNSEFGFQSFPEPRTVESYTIPEDRNITTRVMEHHQRSRSGNSNIMTYMLDWFRIPSDFNNTLWVSQILQGTAIKYAVEHWRRNMPRGMGTLYWQLNDNWPVASWASIDYFGRWKALHYMAKRFFEPVSISGVEDIKKKTVEVWVVNDRPYSATGRAKWTITDFKGNIVSDGSCAFNVGPGKSAMLKTLNIAPLLKKHEIEDLLVWLTADSKGDGRSENLVYFARPKHMPLADPGLSAKVTMRGPKHFDLEIKCKKPALWAWVELEKTEALYSDNFLHLSPHEQCRISVLPEVSMTLASFKSSLKIKSLTDTYV